MNELIQEGETIDVNRVLMLDGNAAAGVLQALFGTEMTAEPAECAGCGNVAEIGALLAFMHAPGVVLRCPACENIMLRIVETDGDFYIDARGVASLRIVKRT
jgi:hypothetical protein